jgi:uncharacterized membrane protein YqjE
LSDAPDAPAESAAAGVDAAEADASLRGLLTEAVQSLSALLAAKLRLAEREVSRNLATLGWVGALFAVCLILCLLGFGFVGVAAGIFLERITGSALEAALIVTGVYLVAGAAAGAIAWSRMKRMSGLFRESREDLKRDLEWLKKLG